MRAPQCLRHPTAEIAEALGSAASPTNIRSQSKRSGIGKSHCNLVGGIFERAHRDDFVTNGPLGMKIGTESAISVF